MKIINSAALVGLPREVLALIRDGVYSLYTLPVGASARYLLVTGRNEFYFLAEDGTPNSSGGVESLDDVEVDQVVAFSDTSSAPRLQVNLA